MLRRILIASDGSEEARRAALTAKALGFLEPPSRVSVLGVADRRELTGSESPAGRFRALRERTTAALRSELRERGVRVEGEAAPEAASITSLAATCDAELVVLGRRSLSFLEGLFHRGVGYERSRSKVKAALIVPAGFRARADEPWTILVPVDFSPTSFAIIDTLSPFARGRPVQILLTYCPPTAEGLSLGYPATDWLATAEVMRARGEYLASITRRLEARVDRLMRGGVMADLKIASRSFPEGLFNVADREDAQLIAFSGPRPGELWGEGEAERLFREAERPLLFVHARPASLSRRESPSAASALRG